MPEDNKFYPWQNIPLKKPDNKKEFNCPWFDEEKKKDLPIGHDPCMFCAHPDCPKIRKVYM